MKKGKAMARQLGMMSALTAGTVVLAGCGTGAANAAGASVKAETVTISFWESHSSSNPPGIALAHLIQEFNQTHKRVKVNLTITKASHKALGALAAGDAPVVAWISHYDGNFLAAHALVSWNKYFSGFPVAERNSIFPVVWSNGEVNGQHYRIQANAKVSELVYNKAIFAKAGIKSFPATWTQLAQDVSIIKQRVPGVIPLAWKDSSAHILPPFLSNGGKLFKPGTGTKQVDFLSPAARETFSYFRNLYQQKEMIFAHGSAIAADFGAGKIAIADGTSAGYFLKVNAAHGAFPVGVAGYPTGSTGHSANLDQGLGFVMMVDHTPADYKAATTFISWWFSPKVQAYWGTHSGYPPETRAGLAAIPQSFFAKNPGVLVSAQALESPYTIPRPVPTAYKEVQSALDTAFYNAVTGRTTVQQSLQSLQKQADSYLSGQSAL
ncbi:extracellular solute-binding protein [Sulfobacillus harzensis]|uniref:Extracellular solute-binding protein n=1 Tax=Sulfobacillus harzensis TaxID=2729629 RepID=A0A7Y0L4Z2_9FIRM|nr:extracellular solute-binding protein [Sulfobacillus harzensis]